MKYLKLKKTSPEERRKKENERRNKSRLEREATKKNTKYAVQHSSRTRSWRIFFVSSTSVFRPDHYMNAQNPDNFFLRITITLYQLLAKLECTYMTFLWQTIKKYPPKFYTLWQAKYWKFCPFNINCTFF